MAQTVNDFKAILGKYDLDTNTPATDVSWECNVCKAALELVLKGVLTVALSAADPAAALAGIVNQIAGATGLDSTIINGILSAIGLNGKSVQDIIDEIIGELCKAIRACT